MTFGAPDGGVASGGHHGVDSRHESPMTPWKAGSGVVTDRKLPAADHRRRRRRFSVRRSTDGSRWNSRFRSLRRSRRCRRSRYNGATRVAAEATAAADAEAAVRVAGPGAKPSYRSASSSRRRRPAAMTNQPTATPTRPSAPSRPMSVVEKSNSEPEAAGGACDAARLMTKRSSFVALPMPSALTPNSETAGPFDPVSPEGEPPAPASDPPVPDPREFELGADGGGVGGEGGVGGVGPVSTDAEP